jgi:hypothetical protein
VKKKVTAVAVEAIERCEYWGGAERLVFVENMPVSLTDL